jgi:hypothetical protein
MKNKMWSPSFKKEGKPSLSTLPYKAFLFINGFSFALP